MKKLLLPLLLWGSLSASAQNALLKNATTGSVPVNNIIDICMVSDGTNVVLLAADKTGIYAIDIADNKASDASANALSSIPKFISGKLDPATGTSIMGVRDIEVNPISKSVYVLAEAATQKFLVKVEKNGNTVSIVNLANAKFSKITWGGTFEPNDMAFGNNTLYVSSGSFSLAGELGWIAPPFTHNASFTKRSTTMFKSNMGGQYSTTAPLETLAFGKVGSTDRLMGVTTCAPGFSLDLSKLSGSGLLQVTEDFNVQFGMSSKSIFMHHDNNDWLFDIHDNKLYRIGKKFLDGSQVTANKHNSNSTLLRDNTGKVATGLTDAEMKQMETKSIANMAKWDEFNLLVLDGGSTGALRTIKVSTEGTAVGIADITARSLNLYPNPAKGTVTISLPSGVESATVNFVSVNGSVSLSRAIDSKNTTIDISTLPSGIYTVNMIQSDGGTSFGKLIVE